MRIEFSKISQLINKQKQKIAKYFVPVNLLDGIKIAPQPKFDEIIMTKSPQDKQLYRKIRENISKFDLQEYSILSKAERDAMRAFISPELAEDIRLVNNSSEVIKALLDKKYGKNGYIFVSIGRAPAAIAKALEYRGVETKLLPISGLSGCDISKAKDILNQYKFSNYQNYMKEIGLTPNIKHKKIIFADFCNHGSTLNIVKKVMHNPKIGFSSSNTVFLDLFKMIKKSRDIVIETRPKLAVDLDLMLQEVVKSFFDDYASIQSLKYTDLRKIDWAVKSPLNDNARLMQFGLIDILSKNQQY